jgi:hypothetical protein
MSEEVLGILEIEKIRMLKSNISYRLLLTSNRLVAAKFGSIKESLLAIAGGAVGGAVIGLVEALRQGKKIPGVPGLAEVDEKLMLDPKTVLAADNNNFELPYSDITKVEMKKGGFSSAHGARAGKMVISTHEKKQEFEIPYGQKFEDCVNVVRSVMPDKVQQ